MTEHRYLADYLVESHVCLSADTGTLIYKHPREDIEIHLRNRDVEPPIDCPTLSVQVIVPASSIGDAEEVALGKLRSFLEILSFAAQSRLRVQKLLRVVEWDPGLQQRRCIQINEFPDPNVPFEALDASLLESVAAIASLGFASRCAQALRWFRQAVSATYSDEQFQYFWFALEVLAQITKTPEKAPDRCPRCRQPLYCQNCSEAPTHRPYPRQAIEDLLARHMNGDRVPDLIATSQRVRNAMLHGDDIADILADKGCSFEQLVTFVGKAAWAALMTEMRNAMREEGQTPLLKLLESNVYHHGLVQIRSDLTVSVKDAENPSVDDLASPQVGMQVAGRTRCQPDAAQEDPGQR